MVTEELTIDGASAEIVRQKQAFVVRQMPVILAVHTFISVVVISLQTYYGATAGSLVWFASLSFVSLVQLYGWLRFRNKDCPKRVSGKLLRKSAVISFVSGCIWGVAPFCIVLDGSANSGLFVSLIVIGVAAGAYGLLSPAPKIVSAFIIPCMSLMMLSPAFYGKPESIVVVMMTIVLIYVLLRGARTNAEYFENMFSNELEAAQAKSQLSDALDSSGEAIAIFDRKGVLQNANSAFRVQFGKVENYSEMPDDGAHCSERSGTWLIGKTSKTSDGGAIVIHTDISDLKNAEQQSQHARLAAEEANRAKTQFLAAVSHELRTPLNAVIGYADLLRRETLGPLGAPEYKDYIDKVSDGGCRLLTLINNIIDLTKFESSSYPLDSARVSTASVIDVVIETLRRSTRDKRHIAVSIDEGAQYLFADENAFKTALEHVLRNALKYTSPVDEIGVNAIIVDGGPCIQVRDAGEGIPLEYLAHVTEPFLQAQSTYDREHEGLGLGLAVAQSIMRAHGGTLEVESVEGAGTFVELRFPPDRLVSDVEMQELKVGT